MSVACGRVTSVDVSRRLRRALFGLLQMWDLTSTFALCREPRSRGQRDRGSPLMADR